MRATDDPFFGFVRGRYHGGVEVSELGVGRNKDPLWVMNGTLSCFGLVFFFFNRMLLVIYYTFLLLRLFVGGVIATIFCIIPGIRN